MEHILSDTIICKFSAVIENAISPTGQKIWRSFEKIIEA